MFKKTIAMTGAAALLALGLTGCGATLGGGAQSEEAAASADNQLCVIPRTPTPQLLEAVSAGLKTAGYEVKVLPEDAKTDACDLCALRPHAQREARRSEGLRLPELQERSA